MNSVNRMLKVGRNITHRSNVVAAIVRVRSFGSAYYPLRHSREADRITAAKFSHSRPLQRRAIAAADVYIALRIELRRSFVKRIIKRPAVEFERLVYGSWNG